MEKINWGNVEAAKEGFAAPPAGGYVLAICKVEDVPDKQYLKISYDIAGAAEHENEEFNGYYAQRMDHFNGQGRLPFFIRSYKPTAQGFFKAFLKALAASNSGFVADTFDNNEQQFVGMVVGAVLAEEEYLYNDKLRVRLKVHSVMSVDRISTGDFKVPPIKKYEGELPAAFAPAASTTVPFSDELPF